MPEFKPGTREEVESGAAQFLSVEASNAEGSPAPIVPNKTVSRVGQVRRGSRVVSAGTKIYHKTAVYPIKDSSGRITGSKRVLYIEKNGTYQPAAVSTDGGASYSFSDPQYPTMAGVAGASLQKDLNSTKSAIKTDIDKTVADRVRGDRSVFPQDRTNLIASEKNTETKDPVPPPSGPAPTDGDRSTEPGLPPDPKRGVGNAKQKTRIEFPGKVESSALTYPLSLRDSKQDKMQFNMLLYEPSLPGGVGGSGFGVKDRTKDLPQNVIGRVFLPIPSGITDTTGASWGEGEMSALQAAAAQIALQGIEKGLAGAAGAAKEQIDKVAGNSADVKTALQNTIAGDAAGVQGLLTRTTGAVLNPNLELLFQKPTLRPFDFTFKMSARSAPEAEEIIRIIRFFKQGMAPIRSASNLFIKSPHTFQIRYIHDGGDHPFLNKFKECALKNMTVNYTPEGNYATFRDGKMISYQITMSFQELVPVFNDEYPEDNDTSLGF